MRLFLGGNNSNKTITINKSVHVGSFSKIYGVRWRDTELDTPESLYPLQCEFLHTALQGHVKDAPMLVKFPLNLCVSSSVAPMNSVLPLLELYTRNMSETKP